MSRSTVVRFGSNSILQLDDRPGVLFWTSTLAIDADGHPQAYHPAGCPPGLDYLANAGSSGDWWGIATDSGKADGVAFIQGAQDPAPGFYISTTALEDSSKKTNDPARYVHSGEIPFIVLPSSPKFSPNQKLGDLAMAFNNANGKCCWACYADVGPRNELGEGSIALAEALGINSDPKKGGTSQETIAVIYWPGSSSGFPSEPATCQAKAYQLFKDWGGYTSAAEALPQFSWHQFPDLWPAVPTVELVVTVTIQAPPGVVVKVIQS